MSDLVHGLGDEMLRNYIVRYEAGAVQARPRLRFVDGDGRACPAAACAGAGSREAFAGSDHFLRFRGSVLERISRRFEAGDLSSSELYRECLLERARRRGARRPASPHATARKSSGSERPTAPRVSRISVRTPGVPTAAST